MDALELFAYISKPITLIDNRTGTSYQAVITNTRKSFGKIQVQAQVKNSSHVDPKWFTPTALELSTVRV